MVLTADTNLEDLAVETVLISNTEKHWEKNEASVNCGTNLSDQIF